MTITYTNEADNLDWQALSDLYERAPLGNKTVARLKTVFAKSQYKSFALDGAKLVGAARAFSDTLDCAVVCDVAVLPEYQGKGVGRQVMQNLMDDMGSYERIMLFATIGKEAFYKQFGFGLMTTAMCIYKDQESSVENGYVAE